MFHILWIITLLFSLIVCCFINKIYILYYIFFLNHKMFLKRHIISLEPCQKKKHRLNSIIIRVPQSQKAKKISPVPNPKTFRNYFKTHRIRRIYFKNLKDTFRKLSLSFFFSLFTLSFGYRSGSLSL